jgi:hypothetical protein
MKILKITANGTPYIVKTGLNEAGQKIHYFELHPPVTTRIVQVHTVYGRFRLPILQLIAEAFQNGWDTGYMEGKHELINDAQRTYIEGEDFTDEHQRAHN